MVKNAPHLSAIRYNGQLKKMKTIEKMAERDLINLKKSLYDNIQNKIKIYLDLNFFIDFIKIDNQIKVSRPNLGELYELLKLLISKNKAVILITDTHIFEAFKKKTDENYKKLIIKMNELSKGICISDYKSIDENEILFSLRLLFKIHDAEYHLLKSVYTKPFFLLAQLLPDMSNIAEASDKSNAELQCLFLNEVWEKDLNDIFLNANSEIRHSFNFEEIEERIKNYLTVNRMKFADEYKDFKDLYKKEVFGTLNLYKYIFSDYISKYYRTYEKGENEISDAFYSMKNDERVIRIMYLIIESIFSSNQYNVLPSIMIGCGLHTLKRYNQESKYLKGDFFDILHAKRALPYSDYFFTEKTLRGQIMDARLALGKKFNCKVINKPIEGIELLNSEL